MERLVGEDFINQVVMSIFKEKEEATEKQKEYIKKLLEKSKVSEDMKAKILSKLDGLTKEQAQRIIEKLKA